MKMKKAIIGSGGFGREVRAMILDNDPSEVIQFFVDPQFLDESSMSILDLDVNEYEVVVAIGDPSARKAVIDKLPASTKYFTVIHKSVQILDLETVEIGEGSIICPNTILTTNIKIGMHSHLNLFTTIGHDTVVGDFLTTAPGAKISGSCSIGECFYIGTNASVREKIKICSDVTVGLNSGVVKDITESGTYGGVPARRIK